MTKALLLLVLSCFAASDALVIGARPAVKRVAVRAQEAPSPPPKGRLGATVDQDGKSNVWAVEPAMKVDQESESKGIMGQYGPVIAVAGSALLLVPLLPLLFGANPDQA